MLANLGDRAGAKLVAGGIANKVQWWDRGDLRSPPIPFFRSRPDMLTRTNVTPVVPAVPAPACNAWRGVVALLAVPALSLFLLAFLSSTGAAAPQDQPGLDVAVTTLAGEEVSGRMTQLDDRQLLLTTAAGDRALTVANLLQVTLQPKASPAAPDISAWVELVDGTRLVGASFTAAAGKAKFKSHGQDVEITTRMLAHVRFRQHDERLAKQWEDSLSRADASDLIVVRVGENLDYVDGVIKEVTADNVVLELDGETRPLSRERVDGLVFFNPNKPNFGDPVCIVDAGTPIRARSLKLAEGGFELMTLSGARMTLAAADVRSLDFSAGKLLYLGDVEPDSTDVVKYLGPAIPLELEMHKPRRNQSPDGQPLTIEGTSYKKGLGIRSRTELAYRLRNGYRRLEAIAGIDDEVRGKGGNVRLLIKGDDRVLFDETIDDVRGAVPLSLDVSGVNRLTILVDFGENQGFADHLDLANVRVLK